MLTQQTWSSHDHLLAYPRLRLKARQMEIRGGRREAMKYNWPHDLASNGRSVYQAATELSAEARCGSIRWEQNDATENPMPGWSGDLGSGFWRDIAKLLSKAARAVLARFAFDGACSRGGRGARSLLLPHLRAVRSRPGLWCR
jgi:hypothetical protein